MNLVERAVEKGFSGEDLKDIIMIDKVTKGDMKAFGDLYSKYYKVVFKKLLMMFGDTEKAKDLASEVILKVKDSANKFNVDSGSGKLEGWIKTVAHNTFLDLKRKESKGAGFLFLDKEDNLFEVTEKEKNIEETLIQNEKDEVNKNKLKKAFSSLKTIEKRLIFLRFEKNLSYDEAAEILNVDSSDLRVIWHRAKAKLEKRMK